MSDQDTTTTTPVPLEERIKTAAAEQGWRDGGELDAFEFIRRGSEFHRDLKQTVDSLKDENSKLYGVVAEHIQSITKKEHAAEVSAVQTKIREAATEGDAEKVMALTETLKGIKAPDPIQTDPKLQSIDKWTSENKWFEQNDDMRYDALGFYQSEKVRLGTDDPATILPKVEARIKKMYPDYFTPKNPNRDLPSGDTGGRVRRGKADGLTKDDLDEDEKAHFDQFIQAGLKEKDLLASIQKLRRQRGV